MHGDEFWMKKALRLAAKAAEQDEVPIGAVLVKENRLIAQAYNLREKIHSPLGHAELIALHKASQKLGQWRLSGCTLYVTLEPCVMCAGALHQSRIDRVVFGAFDQKAGALHTLYKIGEDQRLNHRFSAQGGVLESECADLLKTFFKNKR